MTPVSSIMPPPLSELLRAKGSYPSAFASRLREIDPSLPEGFHQVDRLETSRAENALACALSYACQAQNIMNIQLGRAAVLTAPIAWVVSRLERVARSTLDFSDSWELLRFLEVVSLLDLDLLHKLASEALTSPDPEIREVGEDMLEDTETS